MTQFAIDRKTLSELRNDGALSDVAENIAGAVEGLRDKAALVQQLLDRLLKHIPAERGEVVFGDQVERKATLYRDKSFDVLCAPLCLVNSTVGAIYLESSRREVFTANHLRLLARVAWEVAQTLDWARYAEGLKVQTKPHKERGSHYHGLVGESIAMIDLRAKIETFAAGNLNILILGETGTGKEVIAQTVHDSSNRQGRFMAINCAAIQETLLETELFGHEPGAFTGATTTKLGLFEIAEGGTIFLDEIGETSMPLQAKLLRVLQEREFMRVGGTTTIHCDLRIIAATNQDIPALIDKKLFRADLYHRLKVVVLKTTPLRDIPEDIPRLVEQFREDEKWRCETKGITPEALAVLCRYHWPGNVRELLNVIEYALEQSKSRKGDMLDVEFLPESVWDPPPGQKESATGRIDINRVLRKNNGNVTKTAKETGYTPRHVRRMKRKGFDETL